jgi:hypothetical protein
MRGQLLVEGKRLAAVGTLGVVRERGGSPHFARLS